MCRHLGIHVFWRWYLLYRCHQPWEHILGSDCESVPLRRSIIHLCNWWVKIRKLKFNFLNLLSVFAPGREIVEKSVLSSDSKWLEMKRNVIRALMVGVTFGLAQVKQFGIITNLVGGFSMSTLGLVLPPIMYIKFYRSSMSIFSIGAHALIALFGAAAVTLC